MEDADNPMSLQTGPAARNDIKTIRQHLDLLKKSSRLARII
jgi:hypothetical protein